MTAKLIGLCGRSGSGKGYVSMIFSRYGGMHLDTDKIYHRLLLPVDNELSPCSKELCRIFGDGIMGEDKIPDRKKLGAIVFSDKGKLSLLNGVTHKYILEEVMRQIGERAPLFAVVDAPVLFESGFDKYCDYTVCVVANDAVSVERIMRRDGVSSEQAVARLNNQISAEELSQRCDFRIVNDGASDVTEQVEKILTETGLIVK